MCNIFLLKSEQTGNVSNFKNFKDFLKANKSLK
jgi:hypothetical protein